MSNIRQKQITNVDELAKEFQDLTNVEYALLGKCVRVFAAIEFELTAVLIDVYGGLERAKLFDIRSSAKGAFKTRLTKLLNKLRDDGTFEEAYLEDFDKKFTDMLHYRDLFAHGTWKKIRQDELECLFNRRDKDGKGGEHGIEKITESFSKQRLQDIYQIAIHNLFCLKEIRKSFVQRNKTNSKE